MRRIHFAARGRGPLIGAGMVLAVLGVAISSWAALPNPDYVGGIPGDPKAEVQFDVFTKGEERSHVKFYARRVALPCDDGKVRRSKFRPASYRFTSDRVFRQRRKAGDPLLSYSASEIVVRGRLMPGGKAKGYLSYEETLYPIPGGPQDRVECEGKVNWEARASGR
jgi:hypothetical protein